MNQVAPLYINRELSWLEFNQRVLDEARNPAVPLLERLKFLAITSSNLDEFFMVRVGGLQILSQREHGKTDPAGLSPDEQLEAIGWRTRQMMNDQYTCFIDELLPGLAAAGIKRNSPDKLTQRQSQSVQQIFENEIYPILTPMAVTSAEDFPLLVNQSLNVCVRLEGTAENRAAPRFAVIPLRRSMYRFITLHSEGGYTFILLEDALRMFADRFFLGEQVAEVVPFRITRNADLSVREDLAPDLLLEMEELLDARKQSACVRLEVADDAGEMTRAFLQKSLNVKDEDIFAAPGPLDLAAFVQLAEIPGQDHLKYEPWPPQPSPQIDLTASMFDVVSRRDILLYQPFDSFEPVMRLIEQAADDPEVLAIKQILYRTSRNSPIVAALKRAAEKGKFVTAIVELKARFDEARNIEWARNLEQSSVQVIYGVKGLKSHAKVCIIVRREPHGIQRYVHFGTGNYNEITARLYTDVSYMTSNEELGADATSFFNAITGYSQPQRYRKIDAAPISLRDKLLEMIAVETERKRGGQRARIMAKMNSLVDTRIIDALYEASQAGVKIKLNVRGICCLRPGVRGMSENISVISIVDRFLEHSRILYFYHGGDERVFISSADWMPRNLDRRVELLVPIEDPACRDRLIEVLRACFRDTAKARRLLPDGTYKRVKPNVGEEPYRSQEALYRAAVAAVKQAEQAQPTLFETHRAPGSDV
jgi:polyphosphate kinase